MKIDPIRQYSGVHALPGDKSITHRALMFNAVARGRATVTNALLSADCLSTLDCVRRLGAEAETDGTTVRIRGSGRLVRGPVSLDAGNSGTTLRLITGLLAGQGVEAEISGDASLSARPMRRVADPLAAMGADISLTDGHAPVRVRPAPLRGIEYRMPIASAQVKSAILLAGLGAEGTTAVTEETLSRDHTERMLLAMGADVRREKTEAGFRAEVRRSALCPLDVAVPSDLSSCAYFLALGALRGSATCRGVGVNPTRTGFLAALRKMGAEVEESEARTVGSEPVADVTVRRAALRGITIGREDIPALIDEIPVLAVLAAYAEGTTVIRGAEELRVKESDRIETTAALVRALGGEAETFPDGLAIEGRRALAGGRVESAGDHRIAMAGAIGLAASERGGEIAGAECVAISFPDFFDRLLGGKK